ncbi:hypothetical protein AAMO2058_000393400 [Amorphochlora amoebiformis]
MTLRPLLLLPAIAISAASIPEITNVQGLSAEIRANNGRNKVGFLSRANYEAVAFVLPKEPTLEVVVYSHAEDLQNDVLNGNLVAGLESACPNNAEGSYNLFGAGVITPRGSFFASSNGSVADPNDSFLLRQAWDAAIVRAISDGDYEVIESQYFNSDGFDSVGDFNCAIDTTVFDFPPSAGATGLLKRVLDTKTLRVAALGPFNWGFSGNYQANPPVGLWPDYLGKIFEKFNAAYGGDIKLERVFYPTSTLVMNSIQNYTNDLTEPYWTIFDVSCHVLGTESCFFTPQSGTASSDSKDDFPSWGIAVIAVLGSLSTAAVVFTCVLISKEKKGKPLFYAPLNTEQKDSMKLGRMGSVGTPV